MASARTAQSGLLRIMSAAACIMSGVTAAGLEGAGAGAEACTACNQAAAGQTEPSAGAGSCPARERLAGGATRAAVAELPSMGPAAVTTAPLARRALSWSLASCTACHGRGCMPARWASLYIARPPQAQPSTCSFSRISFCCVGSAADSLAALPRSSAASDQRATCHTQRAQGRHE